MLRVLVPKLVNPAAVLQCLHFWIGHCLLPSMGSVGLSGIHVCVVPLCSSCHMSNVDGCPVLLTHSCCVVQVQGLVDS
jgi:hypothetical protein